METRNTQEVQKAQERMQWLDNPSSNMPELTSRRIQQVTPKKAAELLKFNNYEHQRNLRSARIYELSEKIADGRFETAVICLGTLGENTFLINGQHTLNAAVVANKPITVVMTQYVCKNEAELATLWAQFDTGGSRTSMQMASSISKAMGNGWTAHSLTLLGNACAMATFGPQYWSTMSTKENRFRLVQKNEEQAIRVRDIIFGGKVRAKHLSKAGVAYAMLKSFAEDEAKAKAFWNDVHHGLNLNDASSPAYILREFLLTAVTSSHTIAKGKTIVSQTSVAAKCELAWRFYVDGSSLTKRKFDMAA